MQHKVKKGTKSVETRERILQAALELFHEKGFVPTTMRDIADRAGVATGAAYYYFASKDAIVLAFYDRARTEMEPLLEAALAGSRDLRERLRRLIQVKLDYFAPSRDLLAALSGFTSPEHPLSPFSAETREIREHDVAFFKRAAEGSRTRVPDDLKSHLPWLLWMYQMGIILFWINDRSAGRKKTQFLLDKSLQIVTRLISFSGLPLTRPLRKTFTELLETLMA
jgi:AcrR family transcriptional regulator